MRINTPEYVQRRQMARRIVAAFLLFVLTVALPPLGLVLIAITLTVHTRRRHNRKAEATRRLPELERLQMLERAAWLARITESPSR